MVNAAGCISRSGQIVDSTLVAAPARQRRGDGCDQGGQAAGEIWPEESAKAARKDTGARWIVKFRKAKLRPDGAEQVDIAIPVFDCKSYISVDRKHGIIRHQIVTDAAARDGARLREGLIDVANSTGSRKEAY